MNLKELAEMIIRLNTNYQTEGLTPAGLTALKSLATIALENHVKTTCKNQETCPNLHNGICELTGKNVFASE